MYQCSDVGEYEREWMRTLFDCWIVVFFHNWRIGWEGKRPYSPLIIMHVNLPYYFMSGLLEFYCWLSSLSINLRTYKLEWVRVKWVKLRRVYYCGLGSMTGTLFDDVSQSRLSPRCTERAYYHRLVADPLFSIVPILICVCTTRCFLEHPPTAEQRPPKVQPDWKGSNNWAIVKITLRIYKSFVPLIGSAFFNLGGRHCPGFYRVKAFPTCQLGDEVGLLVWLSLLVAPTVGQRTLREGWHFGES